MSVNSIPFPTMGPTIDELVHDVFENVRYLQNSALALLAINPSPNVVPPALRFILANVVTKLPVRESQSTRSIIKISHSIDDYLNAEPLTIIERFHPGASKAEPAVRDDATGASFPIPQVSRHEGNIVVNDILAYNIEVQSMTSQSLVDYTGTLVSFEPDESTIPYPMDPAFVVFDRNRDHTIQGGTLRMADRYDPSFDGVYGPPRSAASFSTQKGASCGHSSDHTLDSSTTQEKANVAGILSRPRSPKSPPGLGLITPPHSPESVASKSSSSPPLARSSSTMVPVSVKGSGAGLGAVSHTCAAPPRTESNAFGSTSSSPPRRKRSRDAGDEGGDSPPRTRSKVSTADGTSSSKTYTSASRRSLRRSPRRQS